MGKPLSPSLKADFLSVETGHPDTIFYSMVRRFSAIKNLEYTDWFDWGGVFELLYVESFSKNNIVYGYTFEKTAKVKNQTELNSYNDGFFIEVVTRLKMNFGEPTTKDGFKMEGVRYGMLTWECSKIKIILRRSFSDTDWKCSLRVLHKEVAKP